MKLKITWSAGVCLAIVVAQAALGLSIVGFGPAGPIPIHFNLSGEANGWGDRALVGGVVGGMAVLSAAGCLGDRSAGVGGRARSTGRRHAPDHRPDDGPLRHHHDLRPAGSLDLRQAGRGRKLPPDC